MGKKNKKKVSAQKNSAEQNLVENESVVGAENVSENPENENLNEEVVSSKKTKKEEKVSKDKKAKKEKKPSKVGRKIKETFSELKKVTWPKFPEVVKRTGIVLAVVVFFTIVLFAFDYILKFLFKLMNSQTYTQTELWLTVGLASAVAVGGLIWLVIWLVKRNKKERK